MAVEHSALGFIQTAKFMRRLAMVKHFRSLVPMAQEVRKPVFKLTPADGAIGSHAKSVHDAYADFKKLSLEILHRIEADAEISTLVL